MSTPVHQPPTRSRWMDWKPKAPISADVAESEPTKPSKPGSVGFVGATSAESPEIEAELDPAELARASAVEPWKGRDQMLNETGWRAKGTAWAEWQATTLNRLFQEQGLTGQPGRITIATVLHGEGRVGSV